MNVINVPAIGEQELPAELVTDDKLNMILAGLLIPSQAMSKALAREVERLRAENERLKRQAGRLAEALKRHPDHTEQCNAARAALQQAGKE